MNASYVYDYDENREYVPSSIDTTKRWQVLVETSAVLTLSFSATVVALVSIASLSFGKFKVLSLYLLSLSAADLLSSVAVIPLSLAAKSGLSTGGGHSACAVSGYLHVSLCAVRMYTLMWAAVDRYLAVRKPQRYDGIQTRVRCQCWVIFSWIMATCLCCPPLLGDSRGHFYYDGFLCLLDVSSMLPYSITLGCLVFIPSVLTIIYTYTYIFAVIKRTEPPKEELDADSSHHMVTFLVTAEFVVLWIPWGVVSMLEHAASGRVIGSVARFWLLFLGESNVLWTSMTLLIMCRSCKDGFAALCTKSSSEISL